MRQLAEFDWPKCDLNDFSKLTIRDGRIHYRLYRQDGTMQEMDCADTHDNRLYVSWFQIHDRYTKAKA
jgi:hypothetical protein